MTNARGAALFAVLAALVFGAAVAVVMFRQGDEPIRSPERFQISDGSDLQVPVKKLERTGILVEPPSGQSSDAARRAVLRLLDHEGAHAARLFDVTTDNYFHEDLVWIVVYRAPNPCPGVDCATSPPDIATWATLIDGRTGERAFSTTI